MLNNYIQNDRIINMYLNSLIYFDITTDNYEVNDFNYVKSKKTRSLYNFRKRDTNHARYIII